MSNDFKDLFGDWQPDDEGEQNSGERQPERKPGWSLNEKEARVVNVFEERSNIDNSTVITSIFVLLRDNQGRKMKIHVGRDVAFAIKLALENQTPDRPLTHDLIKNIFDRTGISVERVTVDDLWQDTFYAKITINNGKESQDIDARPSDAIAIALRFRAPIYVAEAVLEAAQTN